MAALGLTCRIEVHRERLIATLKAQETRGPIFRHTDLKTEEEYVQAQAERRADDLSAFLACIRLVLEPQ